MKSRLVDDELMRGYMYIEYSVRGLMRARAAVGGQDAFYTRHAVTRRVDADMLGVIIEVHEDYISFIAQMAYIPIGAVYPVNIVKAARAERL